VEGVTSRDAVENAKEVAEVAAAVEAVEAAGGVARTVRTGGRSAGSRAKSLGRMWTTALGTSTVVWTRLRSA